MASSEAKTLLFKHNCSFELATTRAARHLAQRRHFSFSTAAGHRFYQWSLLISRHHPNHTTTNSNNVPIPWNVTLEQSMDSEQLKIDADYTVTFVMTIMDEDENVLFANSSSTMKATLTNNFRLVALPAQAAIPVAMRKACLMHDIRKCRVDLVTLLRLPESIFEWPPNPPTIAHPPPRLLDFRFRALTDESLHDMRIECLDRTVTASREALFHVSEFFRDCPNELTENVSALVLKEMIGFMLTETWFHKGRMSRTHALQLIELIEKYRPIHHRRLKRAVEQHFLDSLPKVGSNLRELVEMAIVAYFSGMIRLENAAAALIHQLHFNDYMIRYGVTTPNNREDHGLIGELQTRRDFDEEEYADDDEYTYWTPHEIQRDLWYDTRSVQLVTVKYVDYH